MAISPLLIFLGITGAIAVIFLVLFILKKRKGSITITPERYSYNFGEVINGVITLKLKKSVSSDKIIAGMRCNMEETAYSGKETNRSKKVVFDFNYPLENQRAYAPGEYTYNFSINIPTNSPSPEGVAGNIVKSVGFLMGKNASFNWELYSELKCSGVNLKKKIKINIT